MTHRLFADTDRGPYVGRQTAGPTIRTAEFHVLSMHAGVRTSSLRNQRSQRSGGHFQGPIPPSSRRAGEECVNDDLVVVVENQTIAFSKLSPRRRKLGKSHSVALSPAQRTPKGVMDAVVDWMQGREAEFGRIAIICADQALCDGLAALLQTAVGPGWLDRVTLQPGHGLSAANDMSPAAVAGKKNRRAVIAMGGAAIAGAAAGAVASSCVMGMATRTPASPGQTIAVDQLGGSDNERIDALNELARRSVGNHCPVFEFANRQYVLSSPIKLYSGLKLLGTSGLPAREYGTGTTIRWEGRPNTSIFAFAPEGQARQAFPPDGSPRDISITGILFEGGSQQELTDVFPRLPMTAESIPGNTLWYCNLHNLGVRAMRTFWWGYGTGVSLTGTFHAQAMYDTPLFLGGSENTIFGSESQSFMDNESAPWTSSGKPFIRSLMEKSFIGRVIITAQLNSYHLSIEGGGGLHVNGVQFDAPSESPTNGSAVKVSRVDGLTIADCVFYANMANPGNDSRGIIDISGGREIVIIGNQFLGDPALGEAGRAPRTPIVCCSSPDPVKIGLNGYPGYAGVVRGNAITSDPGVNLIPI